MSLTFWHRGGGWVLVQSALMIAVVVLGVGFQGDWSHEPLILTGVALFLAGGVVGIAGVRALGNNRWSAIHPREGSALVQQGIYAQVRHPLYLSVILVSLGWAGIWQSWPSFIVAVTVIPFFYAKARREEVWLRQRFSEYVNYEKRVPRFFPSLRPRRPAK